MTKSKPSWSLWLTWIAIYTAMDLVFQHFYNGSITWQQTNNGLEGSTLCATVTWAFALLRWHKADSQ